MNDELRSMVPSAAVLGSAGLIAIYLTLTRDWADESGRYSRGAVYTALVAIFLQAIHFAEELITGLHEQLPELFGLSAIPRRIFLLFNIAWLVVWLLSAWGLAARWRVALFPLWFLGIGCIANGVLHPLLSVLAGGYFPGVVTSPVVGVLGILLLRRLLLLTHDVSSSQEAGS